jgi:hypothetical protein
VKIPESELFCGGTPQACLSADRREQRSGRSDLYEWLCAAADATKCSLFDTFGLRVAYDKASDRLSQCHTLTAEAVATISSPAWAACGTLLWGWDSNPQPRR